MGVGRDDDLAAQLAPLFQQEGRGVELIAEAAGHAAGVDFQHRAVLDGLPQGVQGCIPVAGAALVEELALAVQLFDQVEMAQDGGLFLRHLCHAGKVSLCHCQTVAAEFHIHAGVQVALTPVDLVVFAGHRAAQVMHTADPVIVAVGFLIRELIPLNAAQHIHLARILGLQAVDLALVAGGAAGAHAILQVAGGVAVAGEAQGGYTLLPGRHGHLLQRALAVAQVGVVMDRRSQAKVTHCILSCFTL